jgi:hypothetical protein
MDDKGVMDYFDQQGRMWKLEEAARKAGYTGSGMLDVANGVEGIEEGIPWPDEPSRATEELLRKWKIMDEQERDKAVPGWRDMLIHQIVDALQRAPAADDSAAGDLPPEPLTESLKAYHARINKALKEQGGYEKLSEPQQELFNEIADMLMEIKLSGRGDMKRLEDFVARFEEASHLGRLEEMAVRKLRWQRDQVGKIAEIAKEMGHSGTFEKHDLPMVVFYFREGNDKAKEFLARVKDAGFGDGMLVGPGWAAVRIPVAY